MDKDTILAKWLAGEISDADFKKEVSQDDYLSYLKLRKALQFYEASQQDLPDEVFEKIKAKTIDAKPVKTFSIYRYAMAAASVAAIILLFFGVNKYLSPSSFTVETAYNQTQSVNLENGQAVLDANSRLTYQKNKAQLNGSAYFDLTNNQSFNIETPQGLITAQKSKFEVKSLMDMLQIVNYAGTLSVKLSGKNIVLPAGKTLIVYKNTLKTINNTVSNPEILQQESRFTATPLKYVLQDLKNHYGVDFQTNNVNLNKLFTGSYTHKDLDLSLKAVFKALQIPYQIKDNKTIVLGL